MYHPPGYPHRLNTSDGHEKPRWDDSSRTLGMKNLPLPGGWSNKQQPFIHQLTASARVALMNVRRLAGQFWQVQASESIITSSKPLTTRDSSFSMPVFVLLCGLWYTTSALSSNTGKAILSQFRYPITLTFIQFGFIATFCLLFMSPLVRFSKLRTPTKAILQNTFPMGLFQVGGHMFSSMAISRIPVSTVHTIKALSPLFTVAAYALLFGVSYSSKTYISLLPLTIGVMLACSFDVSASDLIGLLCAFGSALVFVSSNIFFKKIMPSNSSRLSASSHKLDKLNLLLYSSGMAFFLMIPLWVYYDLPLLLAARAHPSHISHPKQGHATPHSVVYYFLMNGTVHFAQNIIAFIILSSTSPVTYSIASLIKRVAVICIAIIWFNQTVHPVQAIGIILTFSGLYMYNNAKGDVEKGEKKMTRVQAERELMLPITKSESRLLSGTETPPNEYVSFIHPDHPPTVTSIPNGSAHARPRGLSIHASGTTVHHAGHQHQRPPVSPIATFSSHASSHTTKPPSKKESISLRIVSPINSYPSPPPSLDSPTSHTIPLPDGYLKAHELGRRADPVMA